MGCCCKKATGSPPGMWILEARFCAAMKAMFSPLREPTWFMRFTQFGHQVPRRNSRIAGPRERRPMRETGSLVSASFKTKEGAALPMLNTLIWTRVRAKGQRAAGGVARWLVTSREPEKGRSYALEAGF